MVVLKTYYEIVDRPSIEVNKSWKVCQIILYIFASLSGLFTYIIFNNFEYYFEENCILFPTIVFTTVVVNVDTGETFTGKKDDFIGNATNPNTTTNVVNTNTTTNVFDTNTTTNVFDTNATTNVVYTTTKVVYTNTTTKVVIDKSKTIWGNEDLCNYYEYIPIISFLIGIIFVTFYCMCPRGGSRRAQAGIRAPWIIVPLTLFMTGVFTIIMFHAYVGVQHGIDAFCAQFEEQLNKTECSRDIGNYAFLEESYYGQAFDNLIFLRVIYFMCVLSWAVAFILLIVRSCCCAIDFKIMKLTLSTYTDDESSNEEETMTTELKTGSLNEIDTEILVTETQGLLTKPVTRRKSLPHMYF